MALIERQKKAELVPLRIKLEKEHHDRLVRYAEFMESSTDHIIAQALDFVIRKDKEFAAVESGAATDKSKPTARQTPTAGGSRIMNRGAIAVLCGCDRGAALFRRYPFPDHEPMVRMVQGQAAWLFYTLRYSWQMMMFTTPALLFSLLLSFGFVFTRQRERQAGALPPFPKPPSWGGVGRGARPAAGATGGASRAGW